MKPKGPQNPYIYPLRNLSYEERLKRFGMFSLRRRRLKGDMVEVFKMIHGINKVNLGKLFCIDENLYFFYGRRKFIYKKNFYFKILKYVNQNKLNFFTGVINYWNYLPNIIIANL